MKMNRIMITVALVGCAVFQPVNAGIEKVTGTKKGYGIQNKTGQDLQVKVQVLVRDKKGASAMWLGHGDNYKSKSQIVKAGKNEKFTFKKPSMGGAMKFQSVIVEDPASGKFLAQYNKKSDDKSTRKFIIKHDKKSGKFSVAPK